MTDFIIWRPWDKRLYTGKIGKLYGTVFPQKRGYGYAVWNRCVLLLEGETRTQDQAIEIVTNFIREVNKAKEKTDENITKSGL